MTRILPSKMGNLNGVVASGVSTGRFALPIGQRYHSLQLNWTWASGTFEISDITEIRVKANGTSFIQLSATELDARNQMLGMSASGSTGVLVIPFDRYNLKQRNQEEDTSINTGVADSQGRMIQTFEIEVDFSGDQTTAVVELFSVSSPSILTNINGEPYGAGTINFILKRFYTPVSGAGTVLISDLPKTGSQFQAIERIIFYSANDVITNIQVKKNQNIIWDLPTKLADVFYPNGVRANLAGYQMIDWTYNGDGRGDVPVVLLDANSFEVTLTASGDMGSASSAIIIADYLGSLAK